MKKSKLLAAALICALTLSLAGCAANGTDESSTGNDTEIATLMSTQPANLDEAKKLFQELMEKENAIFAANTELWNKLFLSADKGSPLIEDGSNYGDFLLSTIESAKDKFTAEELKTLKAGADQIKEIEEKLTALENEFPDCGTTPGSGDSVDAETAGMTSTASEANAFPSFEGKDLDGNNVSSKKLFSKNKVTVMNFWFTTCSPCVGELGDLEALNAKLAKKGGAVVGVNSFTLDGDQTAINEAKGVLAKKGVSYKNIWFDSNSEAGQFTSKLYSFPTTYVIDQKGNIVGQPIVGAISSAEQTKALENLIDQALANNKK